MRRAALALLLLPPLAALAQVEREPPADLVLKNAVVHTVDASQPRAEAVALRGKLIARVGSLADVEPLIGPRTKVVDLQGQTVIPGFQEGHGHLLGLGESKMNLDLMGTHSYQEVVDKVAAAVKARPRGEWIVGRGWHESKWTDKTSLTVRGFPTHHALSLVSPDNPVVLERADGHATLVNGRVLSATGIDRKTKAPEGGSIIRDKNGDATGVLVDRAMELVKVPPLDRGQQRRALDLALSACLQNGITTFHDAGSTTTGLHEARPSLEAIDLYREYGVAGGVRIYALLAGFEAMKAFGKPLLDANDGFLTVRGVKLVADGALGSRGAALLEPYLDDPGHSGFFTTPPETIAAAADYALAHGFQVATHAIGDRANRMVLDAYEKALAAHPEVKDPRFRIEHAQVLDEKDIPRFGRLGVIASMQGIHCTSDRPWAPQRIGMERISEGAYAWRKLLKSGARIVNGTDVPVELPSPIRNFYASVTRQGEDGQPAGGFDPQERMTREEALRSYTLEGAYASFAEDRVGSLTAGKRADVVVLSQDIMAVPEAEILETQVVMTIVDGKIWYHGGRAAGSAAGTESFEY